jgi:tRNA-specific 2-thiouridylase
MFVTAIDATSNTVTIGGRGALDVIGLRGAETSFVSGAPSAPRRVWVQHRAHGEVNPGTLTVRAGQTVEIAFDDPVRAIAPGQSAAFYSFDHPDELLGGAVISETTRATSAA